MAPQLNVTPGEHRSQVADRCPYSRSFSAAFVDDPDCPAYQGTTFTVTDTAHRPIGSAATCRHLAVGNDPRREGRFYPRCGLGDAEQRLRWVATVTPARLAVMRSLEEEFDTATLEERSRLIDSKTRVLGNPTDAEAVEALELQLSAFIDRVDVFLSARSARLGDVGLRVSQLQMLLADWSMAWLRSHGVYAPGVEFLARAGMAPPDAALLGAELNAETATVVAAGEVVAQAGALTVERRGRDRSTLFLRGEIDVSSVDALATAVVTALEPGGDVSIDFRDVLFCDLSGLRALVRASAGVSAGQAIRLVGLPRHLQRALHLVGWTGLPGLVIDDYPMT